MSRTAKLKVENRNLLAPLREFLGSVLQLEDISAILIPRHLPMKNMVMPTLVTNPEQLDGVDPLAPVFPMNAAKLVAKLTRKPMGGKIAALLRPCEIRAFYELVKLKQGATDELLLVGMDCLGAYKNTDYMRYVGEDPAASTVDFYQNALAGRTATMEGVDLAAACKACEYPVPNGADIVIGLLGMDLNKHLLVQSQSAAGDEVISQLKLSPGEQSPHRQKTIDSLIVERTAYRDDMFARTREQTDSLEKLTSYLAGCVNCYNCRVACPVCYCKECVFVTDVFNHEPSQYLQWARRKGAIKMPTDTIFYHITRLAHMSTACVGCGQCSNACPNDIPVMELFRTVSQLTQEAFDYEAGRSIEEKPPLSVFREDEYEDVVGLTKLAAAPTN